MTLKAIRRLVSDEELCARLAQLPHPVTGAPIFRTFRDLAVFAATVGFEQNRRQPLEGPTDIFVDGRIMERSDAAMDMVYLIGLAAERRQEILSDDAGEEDELAKIFEEFARGGLEVVAEWLAEDAADPNGDRALRGALQRGGYLKDARSAVESLDDVNF